MTVQVVLAPAARLVGEHCSEDNPGCQFCTVTMPAVADRASVAPLAQAASGLLTAMGTEEPLVAGERVTVTVATTPLPIVESVVPVAAQVTDPEAELQVRVLPALVSAAPGATTTDVASLGTKPSVHCESAGAPPLPLNERLSDTEPPSTAEPDERLRDDVWLKAMLPGRKQNRNKAIRCFAEFFGISVNWIPLRLRSEYSRLNPCLTRL